MPCSTAGQFISAMYSYWSSRHEFSVQLITARTRDLALEGVVHVPCAHTRARIQQTCLLQLTKREANGGTAGTELGTQTLLGGR